MAVIIRLQNLPWSANAMDIRQFFAGLNIPDGGVHIVGGEKGDAFIAFSTDEDARQAMSRTGERLNNVAVKLLLSSKSEMQTVIAQARGVPLSAVPGMSGFANTQPPSIEAFGPGFDHPSGAEASMQNMDPMWAGPGINYPMDSYGNGFGAGMPSMDMDQGDYSPYERGQKRGYSNFDDSCVFVSNMPTNVNYRDIRKMFSGYEIPRDGLKIINNERGKRVGDAFVRFTSPKMAAEVSSMNKWQINGQRVFVERCPVEAFEEAIDSYLPGKGPSFYPENDMPPMKKPRPDGPPNKQFQMNSTCAVVKNLPFDVSKQDLCHFFSGMKFAEGDTSVFLEKKPGSSKPLGIALIEFATPNDVFNARKLFGAVIGGRKVEIHQIPLEEFERRVAATLEAEGSMPRAEARPRRRSPGRNGKSGDTPNSSRPRRRSPAPAPASREQVYYCLSMFGLPFTTTYKDVENFFKGLHIANKGIHFIRLPNGKVGTQGFVEFTTAEDCEKGLEKHKSYIGERYIDLSPITKKRMLEEIDRLKATEGRPQQHQEQRPSPPRSRPPSDGEPGCVVRLVNLHPDAMLEDIGQFFRGFAPIMSSVKIRYVNGVPTGDAMVEFCTRQDASAAVRKMDSQLLMGRPVGVFLT